jgi:hydrogenase maturation protease
VTRVLVAGVGNIFNGDDAFGVEVVRRLSECELPQNVYVVDFGIRGIDLTYALLDGYDATIVVDAAERGEAPGALSLIEVETQQAFSPSPERLMLSPHELDPAKVLRFVGDLDGRCGRVVVVACEPLTCGGLDGVMGLSEPVAAAVDPAVRMIQDLLGELAAETPPQRQVQPAAKRPNRKGEVP